MLIHSKNKPCRSSATQTEGAKGDKDREMCDMDGVGQYRERVNGDGCAADMIYTVQ